MVVKESPEQLALEETIKNQAQVFLKDFNADLPEEMELEYEGFYRRGFFVTKKRYAVIEDGEIIAKGLELVRRDWAPIAKDTQEEMLMAILSEGNVDKAIKTISKSLKRIRARDLDIDDLAIHTQITRNLENYKQIGPQVVAAQRLVDRGMKIGRGNIIRYIIVKGKGSISSRAIPYEQYKEGYEYDIDYYIEHQVIPAVERIMQSFGYTAEKLIELGSGQKQQSLDEFF